MVAGFRAFLSLVMLAGFYVIAALEFSVIVLITWLVTRAWPWPLGQLLMLPFLIGSVAAVKPSVRQVLRWRRHRLPGVVVSEEHAGPLWMLVRELAESAGTRPPDEIVLVTTPTASVSEVKRRRFLHLGFPLLMCLTTAQIRAIVGHELGHYSSAHTRLGPVAYRGRRAVSATVSQLLRTDPISWPFRLYFRLYLMVDGSVSRRQEFKADLYAVRVAGQQVAISSLIEVRVLAAAFTHFLEAHVTPRADYGYLPSDLYKAFVAFVATRRDEMDRLREAALAEPGSPWDTHPPLAERIEALQRVPDPGLPPDPRPAAELLAEPDVIAAVLVPHVLTHSDCEQLPWDDFVAAASTAKLREEARRAAGAGRMDAAEIVAYAALQAGLARWRAEFSGPAALVDDDGEPLRLKRLAAKLDLGATVAGLRPEGSARGARLLGGLGNVKTESRWLSAEADLLILNIGLILMPTTRDADEGNVRMKVALQRWSLAELTEKHRYVPFEEVVHAEIQRTMPLRARLTMHDGATITLREPWGGDSLTRDSSEQLRELLIRYAKKS
ncbi:hypothetical protein Rhe02_07110 [Rhizocola hellebori]|uniref:Peptidase M48 domain-containing protein n=1 Tax=Rhizocola hellebori TaxID=1392758 RepID=A0A8J3Q375_9ACTN|nr:M48 family metallopeptidase [Rhizocola hellebori]GIH02644.1 hypothetical protein Rhe02_07110 [Rhizocola hellebori]